MNQKKRVCTALLGLMILHSVLTASHVLAQTSEDLQELKKTLAELKAGQQAIHKELQELKALLVRAARQAAQPPQEVVLRVENEPFQGEKNARVTLMDFSDYQ